MGSVVEPDRAGISTREDCNAIKWGSGRWDAFTRLRLLVVRFCVVYFESSPMKIILLSVLALLGGMHVPDPVLAQNKKPDPVFVSYLASAGYRALFIKVVSGYERRIAEPKCLPLELVDLEITEIIDQPKFVRVGEAYNIDSGAWVAKGTMRRCGEEITRRMLARAVPGKNMLLPAALTPGDFQGNLRLEIDTGRLAYPALMHKASCTDNKKIVVTNVKSLTPASRKGWSETWSAKACGKVVEVTVTYVADATGMQITVD